mmetsp:Transcript_953/g.1790  ORF Transcript_953/g.1790 Transcript_953/m.1790 type:complete len:103 (-) Transcript_953:354-662(-)
MLGPTRMVGNRRTTPSGPSGPLGQVARVANESFATECSQIEIDKKKKMHALLFAPLNACYNSYCHDDQILLPSLVEPSLSTRSGEGSRETKKVLYCTTHYLL